MLSLHALGADLEDMVRTRMVVVDIESWEEVGRAHGEFFGEVHYGRGPPADHAGVTG